MTRVYLGNIRGPAGPAGPPGSGTTPEWNDVQNKPATFPPSTHTHTSVQISDFIEAVQDAVATMLGAGTNVTLNYDDGANTLTVSAAGGLDAEAVRDAIGIALVGVGNISVAVNDAADTITISTTATQNSTDAALRDRSTHTGTQTISTVTGLQTELDGKSAVGHTHDDRYYTEAEVDSKIDAIQKILVIDNGASVPPGTPVGTIIFERA